MKIWEVDAAAAAAAVVCLVLPACQPTGGETSEHSVGTADAVSANSEVGHVSQALGPFSPSPSGARRLLDRHYVRTIAMLLGPEAAAAAAPPPDASLGGVPAIAAMELPIPPVAVDEFESSAVLVARAAVNNPTVLAQQASCVTQGPSDQAFRNFCYMQVAERIGFIAFRLAPTSSVKQRLIAIAQQGEAESASNADKLKSGLTYLIATILESPSFLYSVEVGAPTADPNIRNLNGFEVATRLSLFLLGRGPSDDLLQRAAKGDLSSPAGIVSVVLPLLQTPEARVAFADHVDELFQLKQLPLKGKDPAFYPTFDDGLVTSMREQVRRFVEDIVFQSPRSFLNVLTEEAFPVDARLANEVYLVPPPASGWSLVDFSAGALNAQERAGIMSTPAMMTVLSHGRLNSPTRRGLFVFEQLLCLGPMSPPPPNVNTNVPAPTTGTLRQQLELQHRSNPTCNGCHSNMDPLGFAFEHFGAIGEYRTQDNGQPVDSTGTQVTVGGVTNDFNGPRGFMSLVVDPVNDVSRCWVRQLYREAVGFKENTGQDSAIDGLDLNFIASGYQMQQFLCDLVSSPAFTQVGPGRP